MEISSMIKSLWSRKKTEGEPVTNAATVSQPETAQQNNEQEKKPFLESIQRSIESALNPEFAMAVQRPELFFPPTTSIPGLNEATGLDSDINTSLWQDTLKKEGQTKKIFLSTIRFPSDIDSELLISFRPSPLSWKTESITIRGRSLPVTISCEAGKIVIKESSATISPEQLLEIAELLASSLSEDFTAEEKQSVLQKLKFSQIERAYNALDLVQKPEYIQKEVQGKSEVMPTRLLTKEEADQRLRSLFNLYSSGNQVVVGGDISKTYSAETDYDFINQEHNPQGLCLVIKAGSDGVEQSKVILGLAPIKDGEKVVGWATFSKVTTAQKGSKEQFHISSAQLDCALSVIGAK